MRKYRQPDLVFLESTDSVGFTAAGISSFRDIGSSAIVRELIQNSLDAAQLARQHKAVIRFSTTTVKTKDIPGILSYQSAFRRGEANEGNRPRRPGNDDCPHDQGGSQS